MKTSNKILLATAIFILLAIIASAIYFRVQVQRITDKQATGAISQLSSSK